MPDAEQQVCTHRVFAAIVIKTGIATGSSGLSSCTVSGSSEASQVAQQEKNPPAVQETQETRVQSLGWGDPLEEGTATHFRILAGESHGQRSLGGAGTIHGVQKSGRRLK